MGWVPASLAAKENSKAPNIEKTTKKDFYSKTQIAECLEKINLRRGPQEKSVYSVTFYSEDKMATFSSELTEDNVPSFIKDTFNK